MGVCVCKAEPQKLKTLGNGYKTWNKCQINDKKMARVEEEILEKATKLIYDQNPEIPLIFAYTLMWFYIAWA